MVRPRWVQRVLGQGCRYAPETTDPPLKLRSFFCSNRLGFEKALHRTVDDLGLRVMKETVDSQLFFGYFVEPKRAREV
jgi:hypothetical protein